MSKSASNSLPHIGPSESIDLLQFGLVAVPAKVDTGADSSAIWASNISEQEGTLSFTLFGEGSPYFDGHIIKTEHYSLVRIKNSFGQMERRYKVYLQVRLAGRTIRARFTLANRQANRFPVLIGRRTIRNKFLVDVARQATGPKRILMLSTRRTVITSGYAAKLASATGLKVTYAAYDDLIYVIGDQANAIKLRQSDEDISEFEFVYFKTSASQMDTAAATACYLEKRAVPFVDQAVKHYPSSSKLYQYMLLEGTGLRPPKSIFVLPEMLAKSYQAIVDELGLPFVLKDIHGNKGDHNYLIDCEATFVRAVTTVASADVQCIAQAFVPNRGDYRVLVLGDQIGLVIHRQRQNNHTHLNNTSKGARADLMPAADLPSAVRRACIQSAMALERQIAGVDIVQDEQTGNWYCLEVNDGPQLAGGSFTDEKAAAVATYLTRKTA